MKLAPDDFEMTPLAAYGLLIMACILGFLGLEKFASAEAQLEQRVISAQTELATLSTIRETDYWSDRLAQSTEARNVLQSQLWQGRTSGVIAAELQQTLRGMVTKLEFDQIQLRVDPDPVEIDGVSMLSFEMSSRARSSKDFADLFLDIANFEKILIIDEFDFSQSLRDRRPPRLAMSGRVPIQIQTATQTGGAAGGTP